MAGVQAGGLSSIANWSGNRKVSRDILARFGFSLHRGSRGRVLQWHVSEGPILNVSHVMKMS